MKKKEIKEISFAAVGDLLLTSKNHVDSGRGLEVLSKEIVEIFLSSDVVFANLESTLPGGKKIETEPRVISTKEQIFSLKEFGVNIVSLGNNHAFDCYEEGFRKVSKLLDQNKIKWTGAGLDIHEAMNAAIFELNGIKIAFLCVVDRSTGAKFFASKDSFGVAPLDEELIISKIKELSLKNNHVIVSPHWGCERFKIPSPTQIEQAKAFIDAGASMIIGHHPHVMQGMEFHEGMPIFYSLGNFLSNEVYWENGDFLTWNRFERTGCMVTGKIDYNSIYDLKQIPVYDDGKKIQMDSCGYGSSWISRLNKIIESGIGNKRYKREKINVEIIMPIKNKMKWKELKKIRPSDFNKLIKFILEKST